MSKRFDEYDLDNDGVVSDDEAVAATMLAETESQIRKLRAQKQMAFASLFAVHLFTALLFSPLVSIERVDALSEVLSMFYISMAGIVGGYMGVSAWMSRRT
jgi:hypothetical protein